MGASQKLLRNISRLLAFVYSLHEVTKQHPHFNNHTAYK